VLSGQPPADDTFEVSLFGSGIGECIAIHIGQGQWVLTDSCRQQGAAPLHLAYLRSIGVDPKQVVRIVVTHWHDDHIDGMAETVIACVNAVVCYSSAFAIDEVGQLLGLYEGRVASKPKAGVRELSLVDKEIRRRMGVDGNSSRAAKRAVADLQLFSRGAASGVHITAISPSDGSIQLAHEELERLVATLLESPQELEIVSPERNHYSVAMWVKWNQLRVLLGADLETTSDQGRGWDAALRCQVFPDGVAKIIKIAHHGSPNGDHNGVWENIVDASPIAILTAYNRGRTKRPSNDDIVRIKGRSPSVFATTTPSTAVPRRDNAVDREIAAITKSRTALRTTAGHIRIRYQDGGSPEVECGGAAKQL
jgi:beta-lactamase superfamily II metal-dependent hydrolase